MATSEIIDEGKLFKIKQMLHRKEWVAVRDALNRTGFFDQEAEFDLMRDMGNSRFISHRHLLLRNTAALAIKCETYDFAKKIIDTALSSPSDPETTREYNGMYSKIIRKDAGVWFEKVSDNDLQKFNKTEKRLDIDDTLLTVTKSLRGLELFLCGVTKKVEGYEDSDYDDLLGEMILLQKEISKAISQIETKRDFEILKPFMLRNLLPYFANLINVFKMP